MTAPTPRRAGPRPRRRRRAPGVLALLALVAVGAVVAAGVLALRSPAIGGPLATHAAVTPEALPTGLDPDLQARFDDAAAAAAADGVELTITSGWRTPEEQRALIADAIATYGSPAEAHRYVLPPEKSAHVQGRAIDAGPAAGAAWLAEHGAAFGLCRTYANEAWHFEPATDRGGTCPPMAPDSSEGWR